MHMGYPMLKLLTYMYGQRKHNPKRKIKVRCKIPTRYYQTGKEKEKSNRTKTCNKLAKKREILQVKLKKTEV